VNVAEILTEAAARVGESTALKLDDVEWSYRAADAASARVAALLRGRGVGPGDRVGVLLPNVPELAIVWYGILRAGGVVVPMDVGLERGSRDHGARPDGASSPHVVEAGHRGSSGAPREREVAFYLDDSGAKLLFAWHALAEVVEVGAGAAGADCLFVTPGEFGWLLGSVRPDRDLCERDGGDTAVILYTAAADGPPRGVELTHASLACQAEQVTRAASLVAEDVSLGTLPLVRSLGGASSLNATIGAGGCLSLLERFDAGRALRVIARDGVTVLQGEPVTYEALLEHPDRDAYDVSTLRICVSVGGPVPEATRRGLEDAFGCKVVEEP
jgi:long-chain acyl-CoA synthetase